MYLGVQSCQSVSSEEGFVRKKSLIPCVLSKLANIKVLNFRCYSFFKFYGLYTVVK